MKLRNIILMTASIAMTACSKQAVPTAIPEDAKIEQQVEELLSKMDLDRQMLSGIGVPSYDMDELCGEAKGKEDVLQEVIREIRRSKGRILSVSCFIRSRLKKAKKNELQKTA